MSDPEKVCPRCGCGMESGWQYASCADFTREEWPDAHLTLCTNFDDDVCPDCTEALTLEDA